MRKSTRAMAFAAIACITAAGTSCSSDSTSPDAVSVEQTTFASTLGVNLAASTRTSHGAYYRDLVVGTGALVAGGQTLSVRYSLWLANGTPLESNASDPTPFEFRLGVGEVIDGWDEALAGIRVGGQRQLIIPPSLGYGAQRVGSVPANSVLVFTVQVVSAR